MGSEFWSDGGYIGTVGEGVTAEIIRDYIEKQGMPEEKEGYKQMNLLEFVNLAAAPRMPRQLCCGVRRRSFDFILLMLFSNLKLVSNT